MSESQAGQGLKTLYCPDPTQDFEAANKRYVDRTLKAVKSADETIDTSTVMQNDDELVVAVQANTTYKFVLILMINSVAAADFKWQMALPAGASGDSINGIHRQDAFVSITDITASHTLTSNAVDEAIVVTGRIIIAGTAGNAQLQWAQNTSNAGDTTVLQGASLVLKQSTP